jgi:O-antigen ligase
VSPVWRERGIAAFLASMLVTLVLSYLYWLGVLSSNEWLKGTRLDPVVVEGAHHAQCVHGLCRVSARAARIRREDARERIVLAALCAAAVANVLLMVPGRTGIIVLLVLFVYFLGRALRARGLAIAGVGLVALAAITFATPTACCTGDHAGRRGVRAMARRRAARPTSSVGLRLEFLQNTLAIIRGSPVLGVGTGGFGKAYADRFDGTGAPVTQNPHNEILLMMVQFGIAGFVLLAGLFVTQWRLAPRLESRSETAARARWS